MFLVNIRDSYIRLLKMEITDLVGDLVVLHLSHILQCFS